MIINEKTYDEDKKQFILTNLVVFHRQVVTCTLQMSYLHEIPSQHSFSYVDIVVAAIKVSAALLQIKPGHDTN